MHELHCVCRRADVPASAADEGTFTNREAVKMAKLLDELISELGINPTHAAKAPAAETAGRATPAWPPPPVAVAGLLLTLLLAWG